MSAETLERKLAAILSADAVGYSRLMSNDDEATVREIEAHRKRISRIVDTFRGRVVDDSGDNLLAEFPSAVGAVRCALEIQSTIATENAKLPTAQRMDFRIGIHLGDVVVNESRLYGDGVNIAARLEPLASAGDICISDLVYQQIRRRLDVAVSDLGEQVLKNIEEPVHTYLIRLGDEESSKPLPVVAAGRDLSPPPEASLAVLPFINMSGDTTQEHFNDGLTLNIMTQLSTLPGLFLIGADSMFTYKSTGVTPLEAARELGVRNVLQGTVRKSGNRVRVTAQLIDGSTGRHVWGEQYDRKVEDLFDVEDDIASQVVGTLDATLISGECALTRRKHLHNPQAIAKLYRGVELLRRFTRDDVAQARSLFEEVIQLEPESPFGYVEAAWSLYFEVDRGWSNDAVATLNKMSDYAHRALELGDVSGYCNLMLGHVHLMKRDYAEALKLSEKALVERPSCQGAFSLRANILNYCGRSVEAIPLAKKAIRLSPVTEPWFPEVLATACYLAGKFDDAISAGNQALLLAPDSINARLILTAALVESGRVDVATQTAQEILSIEPSFTLTSFAASQPYHDGSVLTRLIDSVQMAGLDLGEEVLPKQEIAKPYSASRRRVVRQPRR